MHPPMLSQSPDTPQATQPLEALEPGFIYAVLTYGGDLASWNWSFFVPNPEVTPVGASGTLFHIQGETSETSSEWKFEIDTKDVVSSPMVVALVQLANVEYLGDYEDIVGKDGLVPMFKAVHVPQESDSRTWFLDGIGVLHDCGVVTCDDVWMLEREIKRCAFMAMDKYLESRGWTAYKSAICS